MYREQTMETVSFLDFTGRSRRRTFRLADKRCHGDLWADHCKAALLSTGLAIPPGMESSVCTDGLWRRKDLAFATFQGTQSWAESICHPVGGKLFLESHFLQRPGLWLCLFLAAAPLGSGAVDDPGIVQSGSFGCNAADPLPAVAGLCSLS